MIRSGRQTGYILLPVIVVITLVAAIALLMNTESALESNIAVSELDAQQAQYVAEAGLNHALWLSQQQGCGPYGNLTNEPLGNDKYSTSLTTDLGSTTAVTINVDQDSWIRSDQPTVNKGSDLRLHTRNEVVGTERPLIRYDLSPIAANTPILSATAWFRLKDLHPNISGPIDIHLTSADWTETDATWDSMSANMDSAVLATIPSQPVGGVWVAVNLTAQVQAWVNGQANYGITLNSVVDGVHGEYESSESANPPYLDVITGVPPSSPALLKVVGTLANGVSGSITRDNVTLVQRPGFTYLQPDATAGVDTYLYEWKSTWNYGTSNRIWVDDIFADSTAHGLIRFNLNAIPAGARITSARLELFQANNALDGGPIGVYQVTADWDEGVKSGGFGESSWTQRDATQAWAKAGGDIGRTRYALTTLPSGTGWSSWEIGALVDAWVDGRFANQGLLLSPESSATSAQFASSDDTDATLRPKLSITYACACGEVCLAPQGSGKILLVVDDAVSPHPADVNKQAVFESWGYSVEMIADDAGQVGFDTEIVEHDVVFVSATVDSGVLGNKLGNPSIGIVSQLGDHNAQLGLAGGSAYKVGNEIDVSNTDHYITRVFASGPLPIYSAAMEQMVVSAAPTAGQQSLAEIGGDASLVLLDKDDAMEGGGTAAGRRVMLPLGREASFNWNYLNANGRLLVQRALNWGANLEGTETTHDLLLVVVDPASLSAQENARKALIEGWGYAVNLIDEADSQTNFDAALAANEVVYVPSNLDDIALAGKLDNASIGIVFEHHKLITNFGLASDAATGPIVTDIEIIENLNDITSVFPLGSLTIFNVPVETRITHGTAAAGLVTLANGNTKPVLDTLDAGATRVDSAPSPGRRAKLPWGNDSFDPADLSSDGLTIMQRAIEWAQGSAAGGGLINVLFVVGNVGGPGMTAEEVAHQALIESWGYTVEIIDDGASQTDFDTAVANNDVVFTTNDITASSLGTKLVDASIGVVTSEDNLSDEFGLASAIAWESGTLVEINDNTHYITSPFATGVLTILTASESLAYVTGSLSPDLGLLASSTSGYGIVTLEAGDALFGGGNAAGRRAQLPWGGSGFDPGNLNADGREILKRALEWGAGAGGGESSNNIILSTDSGATLGGLTFTDKDLVEYDPGTDTGTLFFDGVAAALAEDIDAVHVLANGHIVLSAINTITLGGVTAENEDLIDYDPITDTGTLMFDGSALFTAGSTDISALHIMDDGHLLLTNEYAATLGGQSFGPNDIVDYDPATDTATLYFDGDSVGFSGWINALHLLSNGHLVLSTNAAATLGGLGFTEGDFVEYDPGTDTATLYFDGALFAAAENVRSLHIGAGSGVGSGGAGGGGPGYTELAEAWSATTSNTWQTVDLSVYGVPANAVVEVAVENKQPSGEFWGGVRAVGSGLERRFLLHEAEGGGVDAVTLHVQTDASSQIQHYAGSSGFVSFRLLGYWDGATYVERFDAFKAGADASWQSHDLGAYGVGPDQVAEIALSQTSTAIEWLVGARRPGSGLARQVSLHEAEGGGTDVVTLMAATDASSIVEVYAGADSVVDFHLLGYWSTPPGTYTETGGVQGQATVSDTWQSTDLSGFGIPANSVAQFVMSNQRDAAENSMGLRETTSTINDRRLDLQEAESGGGDLGSMHVKVDASSQIQWAAEHGATEGFFYPVGWWD